MVGKEALHEERQRILNELLDRTRQVLTEHFPVFCHALDHLLREEVLSGEEFRAMLEEARALPKQRKVEEIEARRMKA
jgi:ATP-dependent Zn protease